MSNAMESEPIGKFKKRVFSGVQPSGGLTLETTWVQSNDLFRCRMTSTKQFIV